MLICRGCSFDCNADFVEDRFDPREVCFWAERGGEGCAEISARKEGVFRKYL
jgi:hypothetical protein